METEALFVYGTLQDPLVQWRVFGRIVEGQPDTLPGFYKGEIALGDGVFPIALPDHPDSVINGRVLDITPDELARIDIYETAAYRRIRVTLDSGRAAWVYCL